MIFTYISCSFTTYLCYPVPARQHIFFYIEVRALSTDVCGRLPMVPCDGILLADRLLLLRRIFAEILLSILIKISVDESNFC